MECLICSIKLTGKQARFCSRACGKKDWKNRNKKKLNIYVQRSKKKHRQEWFDYLQGLKSRPCTDCGVSYHPYVMDFDHVRGTKVRAVSQYNSFKSLDEIKQELLKCELVCANCHRVRTLTRMTSS